MISGKVNVDLKAMESLKRGIRNKGLRKAVTAGLKPVRDAVKAAAPIRFGFLRQSIGVKIKTYKDAVAGIVGPRSKFEKVRAGQVHKPTKYAAIVNRHKHFLDDAFSSSKSQYAQIVTDVLAQFIASLP